MHSLYDESSKKRQFRQTFWSAEQKGQLSPLPGLPESSIILAHEKHLLAKVHSAGDRHYGIWQTVIFSLQSVF